MENKMTLDIRGGIKNTKLSTNPYIVFEELISNAIDSYLIRKHGEPSTSSMRVEIEVNFRAAELLEDTETMDVSCKDNGCGFGQDQLKAFLTKDTSYKDDLEIAGIGKCKGAGRIQFFHHFNAMSIDSTYRENGGIKRCRLHYSEPKKQIDFEDFEFFDGKEDGIGTSVELLHLKESVRDKLSSSEPLSSLFSASTLKNQMLLAFLQRLIGLDEQLDDFEIQFTTRHWKSLEQCDVLNRTDLPKVTGEQTAEVEERHPTTGDVLGTFQNFRIFHYKLDAIRYGLPKNSIAFCAKSSPVKDITSRYLRTKSEQNNPVDGFHHIVLIESDYFDENVNEQRDDFDNTPPEIPSNDLFKSSKISYAGIYDEIDPVIHEMVAPASWNKDEVVQEVANQFGINEGMLHDTKTRVVYGESAKSVADRVLKKYQERVVNETEEIFDLKEEVVNCEPDSEKFREKINELSWKYTASLKNFDMANLSQLIVRRAAIVQILDLACGRNLAMQAVEEGVRRKDERIIHSIFFPMRKDSNEVADHDVWLLSEEYHYYDYIASDVPLAKILWDDGHEMFESDIDEEFQSLLAKRSDDNGAKRPDIALFNKEGSAIIVEFKAPGVSMDEHIGDLSEYAHLLCSKSGGRLKKFYGYLIGDTVNKLRLGGWTRFPTGQGWFLTNPLQDPETGQQLGETYFEILHFSDVIDRAKKRIGVYQNKLNFSIDGSKK